LVLAREVAARRRGTAAVKVWYPKGPGKNALYETLVKECRETPGVEFVDELEVLEAMREYVELNQGESTCFVDAIFGFSFKGDVREPFARVMRSLTALTHGICGARDECDLYTVSLDIPSGWSVDGGAMGDVESMFLPNLLISLTAPKACCANFDNPALGEQHPRLKRMAQTHLCAGRFLTDAMCDKYGLREIPLRRDSVEEYVPLDLSSI
jgi:NAD(P)H-hydrate epimerase